MGKYFTTHQVMPESVEMNTPTYQDYCAVNRALPTRPPYEKGDSLSSIKGVPIVLNNTASYGYVFRDGLFPRPPARCGVLK